MDALVVVTAVALAVSVVAATLSLRASSAAAGAAASTQRMARRVSQLEKILLKALESWEAIDNARILKRRRRRRYISAIVLYEGSLPSDPRVLNEELRKAITRLVGEIGYAEAKPSIVYYDPVRGAVIIRTNHLAANMVLAALPLISRVGAARVNIIPIRTAGTLRSAKRYIGVLEEIPSRV